MRANTPASAVWRPNGLNLMATIEQMNWTDGPKRIRMLGNSKGRQKRTPMKHRYDLFEKFPDGSSLWRACVIGLKATRLHMSDLAQLSPNQFYAMHVQSGKLISLNLQHGAFNVPQKIGRHSSAAAA